MAWVESHARLAQHPKMLRLRRLLGISVPTTIGLLHCLWWWALDYAADGDLSRYSDEEITAGCLWEGEPAVFTASLVQAGFLDAPTENELFIHDWQDYTGKRIEQRQRDALRHLSPDVETEAYIAVLRRDPCSYCGATDAAIEIDHIEPVRCGGISHWSNYTAACRACNSRKRTRSLLEFVAWQSGRRRQ